MRWSAWGTGGDLSRGRVAGGARGLIIMGVIFIVFVLATVPVMNMMTSANQEMGSTGGSAVLTVILVARAAFLIIGIGLVVVGATRLRRRGRGETGDDGVRPLGAPGGHYPPPRRPGPPFR